MKPGTFDLDAYEFMDGERIVHGGGDSGVCATGLVFTPRRHPTGRAADVDRRAARGTRPQEVVARRPLASAWSLRSRTGTLAPKSDQDGAHVRATAAESARQTRAVLDELTDPDDELTASAATRHRLEGAALALDAISRSTP